MKKNLLTVALILGTYTGVIAQFTQANEPALGATKTMYLLDSTTIDYAGVSGTSAVWDYSLAVVEPAVANAARIVSIVTPAAAGAGANYVGATKAFQFEGFVTQFFSSTATERVSQGFEFNEPTLGLVKAKFSSNTEQMYVYPMSQGATFTDPVAGTLEFTLSGIPQTPPCTGEVKVTFDGTGILKFPDGTITTGVTRVKTRDSIHAIVDLGFVQIIVDMIRVQYEYFDLANGNLPIFMHSHVLVFQDGGVVPLLDMTVVLSEKMPLVGLNELGFENLAIYPNPATDILTVSGIETEAAVVTITDQLGRVVASQNVNGTSTTFDVTSLEAGVYVVSINVAGNTTTRMVSIK
jgi:hypothetical protein